MTKTAQSKIRSRVNTLRKRLRASLVPDNAPKGQTPPLKDALIGQKSDALFFTTWEQNKKALIELLDAIEEAHPITKRHSTR